MIRFSGLLAALLLSGGPPTEGSRMASVPDVLPEFLDPNANPDGDSLTNEEESQYGTDPFNPDTDGDGVPE